MTKKTKNKPQTKKQIENKINKQSSVWTGIWVGIATLSICFGVMIINEWFKTYYLEFQSPIVFQPPVLIKQQPVKIEVVEVQATTNSDSTQTIENEAVNETETVETVKTIGEGEASYYTRAMCIGCHPNRIMANGEPLDDDRKTVALPPAQFKKYKNELVTITNLDNNISTQAVVTDSGGFEKYNRVADLSLATKHFLKCSDLCQVKIEVNK
jgi:rare lipoprotein A (peptidoglycan hydrolase)